MVGVAPVHLKVRWYGANSEEEALQALSRWARIFMTSIPAPDPWLISLGDGSTFHRALNQKLTRLSLRHESMPVEALGGIGQEKAQGLTGILCGYPDTRGMTAAARALALHPVLAGIPFEYVPGITPERRSFKALDEYADTYFVSPALVDKAAPYAIYEESLRYFEQKCGLRDYLDLYQFLRYVVENAVPGDVAEFGSYRGHSGWLIARTLDVLGSDKHVYLFDAFEQFPPEPYGVDHFWNRTHRVDYEEVRQKFRDQPRVTLIKGDFTQTLATSGVESIALAYIDCDSYRATRYLIRDVLGGRLSLHGMIVIEDYGHPALLGSRAAVHEELDGRRGCMRFFSQFSGLYAAINLREHAP